MSGQTNLHDVLDIVSRILIWSFLFTMVLVILWFCIIALGGEMPYRAHSAFPHLSAEKFSLVHYSLMIWAKVLAFVLFLFPYLAIRIVMRARA